MTAERKRPAGRKATEQLYADRVARGVCRHCGGAVPCWSRYGDHAVGVRHTGETIARRPRCDVRTDRPEGTE